MIHLGHALTGLQPPVRALFVYNANPASVNPDGALVRRGLAREDLFTVVHEQVMTPTARYADLLLPATTFLENRDLYTPYGHFYLGAAEPVIEPVGEARSNFQLFQQLALKMGFTDPPFKHSCEERLALYLRAMVGLPEGGLAQVLAGKLVKSTSSYGDGGVLAASASGKFSFAAELGENEPRVACLTPAGEFADPDLLGRFPFRLIIPPHADLLNSTFGERYPGRSGEVLIHPEDAAKWGVVDGEELVLQNHRGRVCCVARLTTDCRRGVLVAEGIFWPVDASDASINDLTSQKSTDIGNGATFHETLVALAGKVASDSFL